MKRRTLIVALSLVAASLSAAPVAVASEDRPNVVVFLTDDMRIDQLRFMTAVQSELGANGVTFDQAVVPDPLCCPSRTSFLRGQLSQHTGIWANAGSSGGFGTAKKLGLLNSTIATWLHAVGYRTAIIGKLLNLYNSPKYVAPGWDAWRVQDRMTENAALGGSYFDYKVSENGVERAYGHAPGDYVTDVQTADATNFIASTPETQPLFLDVAYRAPHAPWIPAPRHANDPRCAGVTTTAEPSFNVKTAGQPSYLSSTPMGASKSKRLGITNPGAACRTLLAVDESVSTILGALAATGRLENTLLVFTSDNGLLFGEHRWNIKRVPYEESVRVPLIVRWDDGGLRTGVVDPALAYANLDVTATILDAAGVAPGVAQDGTSLLPRLRDGSAQVREAQLLEAWDPPNLSTRVPGYCALRTEGMKLVEYDRLDETHPVELYDLAQDPYELHNLAADPAEQETISALHADLRVLCDPGPPSFHWPIGG